jgi:putative membrane protein
LAGVASAACASNEKRADQPQPTYGTSPNESMASDESALAPASRQMSPEEAAANARGPSASAPEPATQPESLPAERLDDAHIAAITDAANTAEVEQAQVAKARAKNARVKKFAQTMIDHHGKAKADGAKLAQKLSVSPLESSTSSALRGEHATTLTALKEQKADFDLAYIKAQVEGHRKVLSLFDSS